MKLSPRELDHLTLSQAGYLAQKRLARGQRLNHPEAVALIAHVVLERARDGESTVADLMDSGRRLLGLANVLPHVPSLLHEVQVEATFPDGTKLVTIHSPISLDYGDLELALYGSFLPVPSKDVFGVLPKTSTTLISPGFVFTPTNSPIVLNKSKPAYLLRATNTGDRPIQVGSHYHLSEVNPYLLLDRCQAYGRRLNIMSGTAVRFEPGESKTIPVVDIGGKRLIRGGNSLVHAGPMIEIGKPPADFVVKCQTMGMAHEDQEPAPTMTEAVTIDRNTYARTFGPTTGDRIRLGDTCLVVEIEKDLCALADGSGYGDEVKFGGGKVLRDGQGQAAGLTANEAVDTVITNAVILDYTGIYKADVGIKNGLICGIGKAGNPDTMDGVDPNLYVGVTTEVIAGEGLILTAGGIDAHVHYICVQLADEALAAGLTTLLGGGTGPATGTCATTCTPSPNHIRMMMQATDGIPMNFGFTGKGNASEPAGLVDQIKAGVCGLKLHEDWGTTPATIDTCLTVAEDYDIQVNIHTDTLNESTMCEGSIAAFKGRTIHTYHSEGAGGGHAPDILRVCGEENVLPSSTNPTRPFTRNTIDEHLDMVGADDDAEKAPILHHSQKRCCRLSLSLQLMVCHHLDKNLKEDVAFAESRIRGETIAAEDILHDMGAISIISSDSQAMGRIGEVITRTWQTAHKMKLQRGPLPEDAAVFSPTEGVTEEHLSTVDNLRAKRYIAKYTINPAIAHGFSDIIGSVEVGKLVRLQWLEDPRDHFYKKVAHQQLTIECVVV